MQLVFHQSTLGDFALALPLLRDLPKPVTLVAPWSRGRLASALIPDVAHLDAELFEFTRLYAPEGPNALSPAVADLLAGARWIVSFVSGDEEPWAANVRKWAPDAELVCLPTRPSEDWSGHVADFHRHELTRRGLGLGQTCLLYTSPSPRDQRGSRMPSSA